MQLPRCLRDLCQPPLDLSGPYCRWLDLPDLPDGEADVAAALLLLLRRRAEPLDQAIDVTGGHGTFWRFCVRVPIPEGVERIHVFRALRDHRWSCQIGAIGFGPGPRARLEFGFVDVRDLE